MIKAACAEPGRGAAQPVSEKLVGKVDAREVLVTDWCLGAEGRHTVTARWPSSHPFYTQRSSRFSPLLFTETVRQALGLLARTAYDVPPEYRMGWNSYRSSVDPDALRAQPGSTEIVLTVRHRSGAARHRSGAARHRSGAARRRPGGPARLAAEVSAVRDGVYLGTAEIDYTAFPPALYDRLRGERADARAAFAEALRPEAPVPAHLVHRVRTGDVVLSPTTEENIWQLRTETSHRVLFDHPHDHVPGMVLLEAAHQASLLTVGSAEAQFTGARFDFRSYVEFGRPCWIETVPLLSDPRGLNLTRVTGVQDGEEAFSGTLTTVVRGSRARSPI
ncbi:ScbA/BarX family gamma-butyrolactone biosynthesis protein [Streptomyces sp. NPDC012389]|uniref:ScbA/BarX family gamma-butyrolactone biosynthesis protein n=1 Tax=Streptomyces sp. NPDC012389 TaxID=3364830 RepID=UPI0036EF08AE